MASRTPRRTGFARSATRLRLHAALAGSDPIQIYQQYVAAYGLVFREKSEEKLDLPAHEGSLNLSHALPYSGFGVRSDSGAR